MLHSSHSKFSFLHKKDSISLYMYPSLLSLLINLSFLLMLRLVICWVSCTCFLIHMLMVSLYLVGDLCDIVWWFMWSTHKSSQLFPFKISKISSLMFAIKCFFEFVITNMTLLKNVTSHESRILMLIILWLNLFKISLIWILMFGCSCGTYIISFLWYYKIV